VPLLSVVTSRRKLPWREATTGMFVQVPSSVVRRSSAGLDVDEDIGDRIIKFLVQAFSTEILRVLLSPGAMR
jgi:hypothetical protein